MGAYSLGAYFVISTPYMRVGPPYYFHPFQGNEKNGRLDVVGLSDKPPTSNRGVINFLFLTGGVKNDSIKERKRQG